MRLFVRLTIFLGLTSLSFAGALSFSDFTLSQIGTSNTGNIAVTNAGLPGGGSGFVNVVDVTTGQWLVQNMWSGLEQQQGAASSLYFTNSYFNLTGVNLTTDDIRIDYSKYNTLAVNDGAMSSITAVEADDLTPATGLTDPTSQEDAACLGNSGPPNGGCSPALAGTVSFDALGVANASYQQGHPNVLAALNQCAPAAVANSLTWLGLSPESDNNPGAFGVPGDGYTSSLVAQLDVDMNRSATGCNGGPCGVWPLNGKLQWLGDHNDAGVQVNVWDSSGGVSGVGTGNVTVNGVTAVNRGAVNFASILSEIQAGEDVELDIVYPNGGRHYVEVTGAGSILGVNWITTVSDTLQNGSTDGVESVQFDFVTGNNLLPLEGNGAYIDQVISESTPEPATVLLIGAGLAFLARKRYGVRR
jgi:hypothetical protein